jgi:selenide,water dikinase
MKYILADAQTSGGLLISLPESQAPILVEHLHEAGITASSVIGRIVAGEPGIIV